MQTYIDFNEMEVIANSNDSSLVDVKNSSIASVSNSVGTYILLRIWLISGPLLIHLE